MIIVGLSDCPGCKLIHEKYPEVLYKELPRVVAEGDTQSMNLKKRMGQLGVTEFPVVLNDGMTKVLPLEMLESIKR